MTKDRFIHLHAHNEYSLLDGYGTAAQYTKALADTGQPALGITNHGNIDGLIKHQKACAAADMKAIHGVEAYVVPDRTVKEPKERRAHLTLLARSERGLQAIARAITTSNIDGYYKVARMDPALVRECFTEGDVVALSGCTASVTQYDWGRKLIQDLIEIDRERCYMELMPHPTKDQDRINAIALAGSKKYKLPLVATNDCHYPTAECAKAQEVLLAVQRRAKWNDKDRWRFDVTGLYLRKRSEMAEAFAKHNVIPPEVVERALDQSYELGSTIGFKIEQRPVLLPPVPGYEKEDESILLRRLLRDNFRTKITEATRAASLDVYKARLTEEFGLICQLGFQRYFLIVWELINWCRANDILTGPGRGSVGGSLVAYLLNITSVDPIRYGLLFSRFISPARIDLPDIDMDFEDIKRDRVRAHLEDNYGKFNVAGVSTFAKMKGRAALRDVARVFDVPFSDVDTAAKSIVTRSGGDARSNFSIEDAFTTFEDGIKFRKKYPEVSRLAIQMEGQTRGAGQHAAAMCVSNHDLRDGSRCVLCVRGGNLVANWSKEDAEYMGLMKLDVLGLSALTILNNTRAMIKANYGTDIDFEKLPLDDQRIYDEISAGHTIGAFQIGSEGLSKFCKEMGVETFRTLVDATSLWRPGTLRSGMTTEYVKRKRGGKWKGVHPFVDNLTKDTYGVILYQEQVMIFMYELAGLGWRTCDTIRKVISKSQGDELFRSFKQKFIDGCKERKTLPADVASKMWEELATFGCLTGDTTIYRASANGSTGREMRLVDAYHYQDSDNFKHRGLTVLSMDNDGMVRTNRIKRIVHTGRKPVFAIRTNSNKIIRASADHKFLLEGGWWGTVAQMRSGDWIRCSDLVKPAATHGTGVGRGPHNQPTPRKRAGLGKTNDEKRQKTKLMIQTDGHCQDCRKWYGLKLELHHKNCDHNDNSDVNTKLLCRGCHRRAEDRSIFKRYRVGYPTQYEQIDSITPIGKRDTYDIEMVGEPRNFIANGFVSHNSYSFNKSHAVEYSMITYWDMWFKVHYPAEFMAASLTYGGDKEKDALVIEARRLGLTIELPKASTSHATQWRTRKDDKRLFAPWIALKGVGESAAWVLYKTHSADVELPPSIKPRKINKTITGLLEKIHALDDSYQFKEEELESLSELFSFSVSRDPMFLLRGLHDRLVKLGLLSRISDIDFERPTKSTRWYFGRIENVKYGYRRAVLKARAQTNGAGEYAGTAENMGGVYGFFKSDDDLCMSVFSPQLYGAKKDIVEHCGGKWMLVKASHPHPQTTIFIDELYVEEELMAAQFKPGQLQLCSISMQSRSTKTAIAVEDYCEALKACQACALRKEARAPVCPSTGRHDVMIVGEAPGRKEDELGSGFVGKSGAEVLWPELRRAGYSRELFWVTNVAKCFPSKTKTPSKPQIHTCARLWFDKEMRRVKPVVVLALGNSCVKWFLDQDSGIMNLNGTTVWNRRYKCWVCWSMHPASALYSPDSLHMVKKGLDNFVHTLDAIGMSKLSSKFV